MGTVTINDALTLIMELIWYYFSSYIACLYVLASDCIPVETVVNSCVDVIGVSNALAATVTV